MKGLLVSLVAFALYVLLTAVLSHILKPKHPARLFFPTVCFLAPSYFAIYFLTPADLFFLPESWQGGPTWLDMTYGLVVYLLNCHSYIDFFFGFNGGFSMSMMLEILRSDGGVLTVEQLTSRYFTEDGEDKIYGWRLPHLEATRCATIDRATGKCELTAKGRLVARTAIALKRFLNLGTGG